METTLALDHEHVPDRGAHVVRALLTVRGEAPPAAERAPLNLSLVLDRSGSMAGEPIEAAKGAAAQLVRRLHPRDVVSVVAYDDTVRAVAAPSAGDGHAAVAREILRLEPGGSTNLSGGWLRGRELVADGFRPAGTNRIVLLTDGLANAGITDPAALTGLCAAARARGITTTTIGFGPDYDERLLRAMADAGGGNTHYIERADQAGDVFGAEIAGLAALAAQNVAVEIRAGGDVEIVRVHHDYPSSPLADGVRVELGDLYAHEPRALLVELLVRGEPAGAASPARAVATLVVHAHALTAGGGVERREIRLPVAATLDAAAHESPEVRRELLLLAAARAREAALRAREAGDLDAGASALGAVAETLAGAPPELMDAELRAELGDLRQMRETFDAGQVTDADAKYLAQMAYATHRRKPSTRATLGRPPRE